MKVFTVSFFGHRVIGNPLGVARRLEALVGRLLREHGYVEFLVGRDGTFDQLASSVIRLCRRTVRDDNSVHVWVLPYPTAELRDDGEALRSYYDEIEICEAAAGSHFKSAYGIRNREMVNRSDLVVFCVQHENGGAWQTLRYAQKQGVPYINIGECDE